MTGKTQVITANRLRDGAVVYYGNSGWTEQFAQARALVDAPALEAALAEARADERANLVLDVVAIAAAGDGPALRPTHIREAIRAAGPTVRRDTGKQASAGAEAAPSQSPSPAGEPDVSI